MKKFIKLKNFGSLREFVRNVMHIPSLKKEEEKKIDSEVVWMNQRFSHCLPGSHPSCSSMCHAISVWFCATYWGRS
jgi:hypothetical protein